MLLFLPFSSDGLYKNIQITFSIEKCVCPSSFTHNLLMETAAAYLLEGEKYMDIFSALTGGMGSHLPDRLISFLHVLPRNVQHFKFSLSSIAS